MTHPLVPVSAALGGLCWVARWGADLAGGEPGWGGAVHLVGMVFLGLALAATGAGLVSRSAAWLRGIVAVALPLLAWSVYMVLRGDGDGVVLGGVLGMLALLLATATLLLTREPRVRSLPRRAHGSHSAR